MILDTTFIIDLLNGDQGAINKSKEIDDKNIPVFTTSVSVFEIWQGLDDIKNKDKLEKINVLLTNIGLLSLDMESAKIGGKIHAELNNSGLSIQPEDSMIAGICIKNNKKVITRNVKHFSRIKNLEVETY